jgi:hypothetical protein
VKRQPFDDLPDADASNYLAECDSGQVALDVVHPSADRRIDLDLHERLAVDGFRWLGCGVLDRRVVEQASGASCKPQLSVDLRHGR